MLRNKLSNDVYHKVGAPVVRVEYARVSIAGTYFGLFTMEERVDRDFLKCRNLPASKSGTAMYKSYPDPLYSYDLAGATAWDSSKCEDEPSLCTLGFERKLPECDGCDNSNPFTNPDFIFDGQSPGPHLGEQPAACYVQDTAALNVSCPAPSDLHELATAVTHAKDKTELARVLNVSSYLVWQMVTKFVYDCDHGNRNYCKRCICLIV